MNDFPRQKLAEIIAKYGEGLCDQPLRLRGLLRDLCGAYRLEINLFLNALRERIAADLRVSSASVPSDLLIARLSKRLQDHLGVKEEAARWTVESWALALGKISRNELRSTTITPSRSESAPLSAATTIPPRKPAVHLADKTGQSRSSGPAAQKSGEQRLAVVALVTLVIVGVFGWLAKIEISSPAPDPAVVPPISSSTPTVYPSSTPYSPNLSSTPSRSSEGALWVSTDPPGATVIIDGFTTKTTPTSLSNMSVGQHHLQITLEGYESEEREVEVKSGQIAMTGTITLRRRSNQFDGVWVGHDGISSWTMILTIHGQTASTTAKTSEKMKAKADHWTNIPAPYDKIRTLSFQWSTESKSVHVSTTQVGIYWNEWKSQSNIPTSILRKIRPRPPPGQFNDAYPPAQDWGYTVQGSKLVSGAWTFQRKG